MTIHKSQLIKKVAVSTLTKLTNIVKKNPDKSYCIYWDKLGLRDEILIKNGKIGYMALDYGWQKLYDETLEGIIFEYKKWAPSKRLDWQGVANIQLPAQVFFKGRYRDIVKIIKNEYGCEIKFQMGAVVKTLEMHQWEIGKVCTVSVRELFKVIEDDDKKEKQLRIQDDEFVDTYIIDMVVILLKNPTKKFITKNGNVYKNINGEIYMGSSKLSYTGCALEKLSIKPYIEPSKKKLEFDKPWHEAVYAVLGGEEEEFLAICYINDDKGELLFVYFYQKEQDALYAYRADHLFGDWSDCTRDVTVTSTKNKYAVVKKSELKNYEL